MGDRNNPIKFGPEWLRNLSRERNAVRASNNLAANSSPGAAAAAAAGPSGAAAANIANSINNTHNTAGPSKVLLAKLRYGREEMLALYDRNSEAPPELKSIDTLYQPRGKQPVALNNTFEDEMRDNMRSAPPVGGMSPAERYGMGRGAGRGVPGPGRGTGSRTYTRPSNIGRGSWHVSGPRTPSYGGGADDDGNQMRPWSNNNPANRNNGDQTDWASKMFRSKRSGTNTNWRQHPSRDDGEEWRSSEPGRSRQLEKWDRDWGERPGQDKPQSSWNSNRRTWVGGDTNSSENLPEWIGENAECGGTFDSQGAFHGYSNDDTNLPKNQDATYPLTRSHTHSSFARSKTVEEGSDEWWASEKAKKLSPKRFDASDIKFKKSISEIGPSASTSKEYGNKNSNSKDESQNETSEQLENTATAPEPPEPNHAAHQNDDKYAGKNVYKTKYNESKTFDAKMRSDINMDEANDERGNFQSVLIAPNNSLRQKHQHIVPASEPSNKAPSSKTQTTKASTQNKSEVDHGAHKSSEDVLVVNNMFRMPYDELEILSSPSPNSSLLTLSSTGSLVSSANTHPHQNPNMQMSMSNAGMQNQGLVLDPNINKQNMQASGHETPGMQGGGHPSVGMQPGMQSQIMQTSGIQSGKQAGMHNSGMSQLGVQNAGMPSGGMQNPVLSQVGLQSPGKPSGMHNLGMPSGLGHNTRMPMPMQNPGMGRGVMQNPGMHTVGLQSQGMPGNSMHVPRIPNPAMQSSMMQQGGINSALNASLGLPIGPAANMGHPLQNVPQPVYANAENIGPSGMQGAIGNASMQPGANMPGYQAGNGITGISNAGNSSLFLGQNTNNPMSSPSDIPMPNHTGQNSMFPMHGLQHSGSQGAFGNPMYGNNMPNPAEQWYYEDPESNIQGPFSTRDMLNWYRAGFFSSTLMVRRACETGMRPLGSYGPVPFATMDMMPPYPMSGSYDARAQGAHDTMLNTQAGLGLDVDLLWSQTSNDLRWMHNSINESRVNNLSMFFWDQQPSAIASNALLPEEIAKEMKTEDQILAQLRASQNIAQPPTMPYMEQGAVSAAAAAKTDDRFAAAINATPNLEELHRLMQKDTLAGNAPANEPENNETQPKTEKVTKPDPPIAETNVAKTQNASKAPADQKPAKQKADNDKAVKNKENSNTKNKGKKNKDEKKDEVAEVKTKEDDAIKAEKRSQESSPSKNKKEDKSNKKDLEREKKEWIKEGFTIVKGTEKTVAKDGKKKAEEARAAEEAERKRKEEEKLAAEEEKRKKQAEAQKKQQETQQQQQRPASESVTKKAPWSAAANLTLQAVHKDGLTLAEIQRLEREKKLEQMKEQQQMMQIIAQQQAAALAREQEMQVGLGWAKKNFNSPGQSLTEIQAEARQQAVVAAAAAQAQALEETPAPATPQTNHVPWANTHNGVGFWDTPPNQPSKPEKPQEPAKPAEPKSKKKITLTIPAKKETSPAAEFEAWCTSFLSPWSAKIDVPTFIGFLKDIESPYEVKDYVKCYLGDSKDSNDFARQFLERRSKLLRVGMVTPSDDLCSPALAVNPRTTSGSDYQEVKGKGKKTKKNKMLKIDARILGFSVTASEDRINVGDIDTV